jgi:hypothetical protein
MTTQGEEVIQSMLFTCLSKKGNEEEYEICLFFKSMHWRAKSNTCKTVTYIRKWDGKNSYGILIPVKLPYYVVLIFKACTYFTLSKGQN